MKKMILLGFMSAASLVQAQTVNIVCDMPNMVFQNQFSLNGSVSINGNDYSNGNFSVKFKNNGNTGKEFDMNLSNDGSVKVFAAGTIAKDEVIHIESASLGAEVEHMSLLVNFPGPVSSQIRFSNGRSYKASCSAE